MDKLPRIIYLIIGIPLSSLILGVVLLVAASMDDGRAFIPTAKQPLSKTSWQQPQPGTTKQ